MQDYTNFDSQLLLLIGNGVSTFTQLTGRLEPLAIPFCKDSKNKSPGRVVDRRLQALRRAKKITYLRTGWALSN